MFEEKCFIMLRDDVSEVIGGQSCLPEASIARGRGTRRRQASSRTPTHSPRLFLVLRNNKFKAKYYNIKLRSPEQHKIEYGIKNRNTLNIVMKFHCVVI